MTRVAGYALGVAVSVASAGLLFRHLGVESSGTYVVVVSLVVVCMGLTDAGLAAIAVRELTARDRSQWVDVVRDMLGIRAALSLVGLAVAIAYAVVLGPGRSVAVGALLVGLAVTAQGGAVILTAALQADFRFTAVAAVDLSRQLAGSAAIAVLVLVGAPLTAFFAALLAANVVALFVGGALTGRHLLGRPRMDVRRWRSLTAGGLSYGIAVAVGLVYLRVGVLIVDRLGTGRTTGLYALSFRVVEVAMAVPILLAGTAFPALARTARTDPAAFKDGVQRAADAIVAAGLLAALLLGLGAPTVIRIVGGNEFGDAADTLRWHSVALLGTFANVVYGYALLAVGRTRAVLAGTLAALVVAASFTVPLVARFGAPGAAAGAAAAEFALLGVGALFLRRQGVVLSYRMQARLTAAALVAAGAGVALPTPWGALVAATVYGVLIIAMGFARPLVYGRND